MLLRGREKKEINIKIFNFNNFYKLYLILIKIFKKVKKNMSLFIGNISRNCSE